MPLTPELCDEFEAIFQLGVERKQKELQEKIDDLPEIKYNLFYDEFLPLKRKEVEANTQRHAQERAETEKREMELNQRKAEFNQRKEEHLERKAALTNQLKEIRQERANMLDRDAKALAKKMDHLPAGHKKSAGCSIQ